MFVVIECKLKFNFNTNYENLSKNNVALKKYTLLSPTGQRIFLMTLPEEYSAFPTLNQEIK